MSIDNLNQCCGSVMFAKEFDSTKNEYPLLWLINSFLLSSDSTSFHLMGQFPVPIVDNVDSGFLLVLLLSVVENLLPLPIIDFLYPRDSPVLTNG